MSNQLQGLTVLVTRPAHQAEAFCLLVEAAGGQAIRFPVIEIQQLELDETAEYALQKSSDCLVFISANAVRLGVAAINNLSADRINQSRVMAIGKATAHELEDFLEVKAVSGWCDE